MGSSTSFGARLLLFVMDLGVSWSILGRRSGKRNNALVPCKRRGVPWKKDPFSPRSPRLGVFGLADDGKRVALLSALAVG